MNIGPSVAMTAAPTPASSPPRTPRLITFALLGYGPALGGYLLLTIGFLLNAVLSLASEPSSVYAVASLGHAVFFVGFPAAVVAIVYRAFRQSRAAVLRGLVLYLGWLALAAGFLYAVLGAIAGTSMAVVEGLVSGQELQLQLIDATVRSLLPAQLFILPWVTVSLLALRRIGARRGVQSLEVPKDELHAHTSAP